MKILVIDDSAFERRALKSIIEKDGHEVIDAKDGQEGLEKTKAHAPDLVITDILMPRVDGFHLLRSMKKDKRLQSIPVIVYSGVYEGGEDRDLAYALGAESYISKPENPAKIWESVKLLLDTIKTKKEFTGSSLVEDDELFLRNYGQIVATRLEAKVKELALEVEKHKQINEEIYLLQSIALAISSSKNLHDALVVTIKKLCTFTGWVYGEAWMPNQDGTLLERNHRFYSSLDIFEVFTNGSGKYTFSPGEGLPGRTWSAKQPVWVNDITVDPNYIRSSIAREVGLKMGIAFPIITGNEVVAVVVFYHVSTEERDDRLVKLILAVLSQIGSIIKHKQAEDALRKNEELMRLMLDNLPVGVWTTDKNGVITRENPAGQAICGSAKFTGTKQYEKIKGWWLKTGQLIQPDEWPLVRALKQGEVSLSNEIEIECVDGTHKTVLCSAAPIRNDGQEVTGAIMVGQDITVCRQTEAEKDRLREQLYHAQSLASVGKLAGGVAHNFNNMLTVILGYASLLLTDKADDDLVREYAERIVNTSQTAANLTQDLLTFSRKKPFNPQPVDMNVLVKEAEAFMTKLIKEDIELNATFAETECAVLADCDQIKNILMNLATNARDAMPNGGKLIIRTSVTSIDQEFIKNSGFGEVGDYVLITVSDTGSGMDEDTRLRIFDPFFTTKEVGRGTGLGLSIVYGIVKQHNGYIDVHSKPGKGTTFSIYLPRIGLGSEQVKADMRTVVCSAETILLAEDELEVRKLIKTVLENAGYCVIEAGDGEDAVAKFIKNKDSVTLMVLDIIMPRKNGKQAYDAIRALKPDAKAFFISGYGTDIISKTNIHEEGLNYILKPVSPDELLKKIKEILRT